MIKLAGQTGRISIDPGMIMFPPRLRGTSYTIPNDACLLPLPRVKTDVDGESITNWSFSAAISFDKQVLVDPVSGILFTWMSFKYCMLITQPFAPPLSHQTIPKTSKTNARNVVPMASKILYDVNEILERNADISVKDLLIVAPSIKRELFRAIKSQPPTKKNSNLALTFFEDDDVDTTAIYTNFYVNDICVKSMLDTGSAKTCMSKEIADKLQLVIDSPSTSVFTLGNRSKQASLPTY